MYTRVHVGVVSPVLWTAGRHDWVRTEEACSRPSGRGWVGTVAALRNQRVVSTAVTVCYPFPLIGISSIRPSAYGGCRWERMGVAGRHLM
jgi:hypothetical protein